MKFFVKNQLIMKVIKAKDTAAFTLDILYKYLKV